MSKWENWENDQDPTTAQIVQMLKSKIEEKRALLKRMGVKSTIVQNQGSVELRIPMNQLMGKIRSMVKEKIAQMMTTSPFDLKTKIVGEGNQKREIMIGSVSIENEKEEDLKKALQVLESLKTKHPIDYLIKNKRLKVVIDLTKYYQIELEEILTQIRSSKGELEALLSLLGTGEVPQIDQQTEIRAGFLIVRIVYQNG